MATTHRAAQGGAVVIVFRGDLGSLIAVARRAQGWSQQRLAQALYMDPRNLARIELSHIGVDLRTVVRTANVLRYPPLVKRAMALIRETVEEYDRAA